MTDHSAAHSSSSCNYEELRNIDKTGENSALRYMSIQFRSNSLVPYQQYQHPLAMWDTGPMWRRIRERYDIQEQKSADRCLVEQKLHAIQVELFVIGADPNSVQRTCKHSRKSEEDSDRLSCLDLDSRTTYRSRVIVRYHDHAAADGNQAVHCPSGYACAIKQEVDDRGKWRQQYSDDLVEGDGGEC
jgi:hypothetical protein